MFTLAQAFQLLAYSGLALTFVSLSDVSQDLQATKRQAKDLQEELREKAEDAEEMEAEIDELETEVGELRVENGQLKKQLEEITKKYEGTEAWLTDVAGYALTGVTAFVVGKWLA